MNLVLGLLVVVLVTAGTVAAMLFVRRRAPVDSYFSDGDRASGVFGVLATGFSVLLGFIIFLAFAAYDESRAGAEAEATIVAQQLQTAQFLPASSSPLLTGELTLLCPLGGRGGVGGSGCGNAGRLHQPLGCSDLPRPFALSTRRRRQSSRPTTVDVPDVRPGAGAYPPGARGRGDHPAPAVADIFIICGVIFGYMMFFADRAERAGTQAMLMGSSHRGHHPAHAPARLLRPPSWQRGRTPRTDRHGTDAAGSSTSSQVVGMDTAPPCDDDGVPR